MRALAFFIFERHGRRFLQTKVGGSIFGLPRLRCVLLLMRALSSSLSLGRRESWRSWFACKRFIALLPHCLHLASKARHGAFFLGSLQPQQWRLEGKLHGGFMLRSLWFSCSLSTAFSGTSWCRSLACSVEKARKKTLVETMHLSKKYGRNRS